MTSVRLDDEAKSELRSVAFHYDERHPGLGAEWLASVGHTLTRLGRFPRLGPPLRHHLPPELGVRQLHVKRFPYLVIYVVLSKEVRVLAIAHERRHPTYWAERLSNTLPPTPEAEPEQ